MRNIKIDKKIIKIESFLNEGHEIGEKELEVITYIYKEFSQTGKPRMGARTLRKKYGKEFMVTMTNKLPKFIESRRENWNEYYYLTPEGFFLCSKAKKDFELIVKYLDFLRNEFNKNPEVKKVLSEEITKMLNLSDKQSKRLRILIDFVHLWSGSAHWGEDKWDCGVPLDIEDLDELNDPKLYLRKRLQEEEKRHVEQDSKTTPDISLEEELFGEIKEVPTLLTDLKETLDFLKHNGLRKIVERDLDELEKLQEINASKSTLIFCGIIVETILLDVLDRRPDIAQSHLKKPENWPDRASLEDMIKAAKSEDLISETSAKVADILKMHRDLVHPYRILKSQIIVDPDTARMMILLLKMICRDLSNADKDGKIRTYEEQ